LDISATAISQLAERLPGRRDQLVTGNLSALRLGQRYPLVVAIQVMQHGTRAETHGMMARPQLRPALQAPLPSLAVTLRTNVKGAASKVLWALTVHAIA